MRVDAHHHVWQIARGDYGWLTPDLPIYRDYGLDDLRPLLGDITATILVQAAPTAAETGFLLQIAADSNSLVRGVVGWADFSAPDAPARIAALARNPLLKGLRPMLQDIAETEWILRPEHAPALAAMVDCGLRFDALVRPRHLPVLLELARRYPELPMVVDHAAKPVIAPDRPEPAWAEAISRLAAETGAFCKLSGLVTEAAPGWSTADLRPTVDHLIACFGPDRLLWGSDWPVVDRAGGFLAWRQATLALLADLHADVREAILGGTARSFYGLAPMGETTDHDR